MSFFNFAVGTKNVAVLFEILPMSFAVFEKPSTGESKYTLETGTLPSATSMARPLVVIFKFLIEGTCGFALTGLLIQLCLKSEPEPLFLQNSAKP